MQQRSKFIQRTSALALAAVLALGMGVQAAGPGASTVDDRREDLTIFYETLKDSIRIFLPTRRRRPSWPAKQSLQSIWTPQAT